MVYELSISVLTSEGNYCDGCDVIMESGHIDRYIPLQDVERNAERRQPEQQQLLDEHPSLPELDRLSTFEGIEDRPSSMDRTVMGDYGEE